MLLEELKQKTRAHHESLEKDMESQRYFADLPSYRRLLERWYGWYEPWERMVAQQASPEIVSFMRERWKLPLLLEDLRALHAKSLDTVPRADVPVPESEAEWIGTLYVLEGSTLGGQYIARSIEQQFGLRDGRGYSFFRSYGDQVGSMWRSFRTFAQDSVSENETERAVSAADHTFSTIHQWLCPKSK
jgi:heme oxygenase